MIDKSIEASIHFFGLTFILITGIIYLCYRYYKKKCKKRN